MVTLSRPCHMSLHRRFRNPSAWRDLLLRHPTSTWAKHISLEPFDLAAWIRQHAGTSLDVRNRHR